MKIGVLYKNVQIPFKFETPNSLGKRLKKIQSAVSIRSFIPNGPGSAAKLECVLHNIN